MRFLIRLAASAAALWVAVVVVDGVTVPEGPFEERAVTLLAVALIFGLVNAVVRPIVKLLSLPLVIVTLGLFIFVVNALMLIIVSVVAGALDVPFTVEGFVPALAGSLVVSLVSFAIDVVLPKRYERR